MRRATVRQRAVSDASGLREQIVFLSRIQYVLGLTFSQLELYWIFLRSGVMDSQFSIAYTFKVEIWIIIYSDL